MAEIKNTFLKGKMNQDLDPRILPNGEYREARNLSISRSEGSTVGEFENVLGNISIASLNSLGIVGEDEFIGYVVDNSANVAYLMATDWKPISSTQPNGIETRAPLTGDGSNHFIVKVDLSSINTPPVVLAQGSFLNFNQNFIITGINLVEDQLFWTDNLNQPRKINVTKALADSNHYTNEDQISVAKFAPWEPILVMDRVTTTITGASGGSSVITPASFTDIKVGDIVTNNNKIDTQNITSLIAVVGITEAPNPTLLLSSSITVPDGTSIDFSRPTMTNKKDSTMANHSSSPIISVTNPGSTSAVYEYGDASIGGADPDLFIYNGNNGIPKIGDLVSGTGVPSNTRVTSVSVIDQRNGLTNPTYKQTIKIGLDKVTTLAASDVISVSDNPDYNPNWQGDEKFLEDKFVRFSYRFKFEDNEYSLMAPFSQVMFIPKQYSQFGGGKVSTTEDMDDAYKSTVVTWFENNINNILLKIPMEESSVANMINLLKVTDIDILYKESDALAVKVLETITLSDQSFSTINFNDAIHGNDSKAFLDYDYTSSKPYKTLPNNQVTRVSDKVPVRALAQEVIGNRIVYGNYLDRHTGPSSIAFEAKAVNKSTRFDNYTQFPKHQLKQDRTYQVGFVLSDRYGRQSDVILSSYDSGGAISGSTVFNAYNNLTEQTNSPILDWLGNALNVTLNEAIQSTYSSSQGTPGIYSSSNPLGWFSYKVVVKQTEQEYYNAYLPGFVNGYPVQESVEKNKSFFTTLLGDNVNKIPRNLIEVGASDRDFTSSEDILIRVNNPSIVNKPVAGLLYEKPYNVQYYPGNIEQEVTQISTVRDMEIAAIPFKANVNGGEYGKSGIINTYNYDTANPNRVISVNDTPEQIGAIPWGKTGPDPSLYNTDSNLFVVRGNQSENINNPIGAIVTSLSTNTDPVPVGTLSMVPFLSVAETKPVESLLDIYWETSLSGSIVVLNDLIDSQYGGLIGANFQATTFPESVTDADVIGSPFNFTDGSGNLVSPADVTIVDWSVIDGNGTVIPADTFNIAIDSLTTPTGFQIKPGTGKTFFYNTTADLGYTGVYTITVNTSYTTGAGVFPDSTVLPNISLSNVAPTIDNFTQPSNITTASGQTIIDLSAVNGSADTNVNTQELVWELNPERLDFSIDSSTGVITSTNNLAINTDYNIDVIVKDLNGSGLTSAVSTVSFTTGAQRINKALCEGFQAGFNTFCSESMQMQFLASSTVSGSSVETVDDDGVPGGTSVTYPANSTNRTYNVFARNPSTTTILPPSTVNHTTGALTQGTLYIQPTISNSGASIAGDVTVSYTIQEKFGTGFIQATDSDGFPIYNLSVSTSENSPTTGSRTEISKPGEYRILTTVLTGTLCGVNGGGTSTLIFNFGDAVYSTCTTAPA